MISDGWIGDAGATRYGEALHPGPPSTGDAPSGIDGQWEAYGCAWFKRPHQPGFEHALMDLGEPATDDGDKEEFTLVADTCNATSWSGARRYLVRTSAELVLLQEHHLPPARLAEASAWALRHHWHSIFIPAAEGSGGGWRGGVAILARPHIGLSVPMVGPVEVVPARVMAASIEPPGFRQCTVVCAYLEDGQGMSAANLRHLGDIGRCIKAQGEHVPCIAGGDWQAAPAKVAATGFATQAGMTLVASAHPRGTYRAAKVATELDYFFLSNDLALGLDTVGTVEAAGVRPHVPARVTFLPKLTSTRALHVRCPPPLPVARIIGPLRQPPEWRDIAARARRLAARAADPEDACGDDFTCEYAAVYSDWADTAEHELIEATGAAFFGDPKKLGLRGKAPVLRWRSILAERPPMRSQPSLQAQVEWRELSAKAVEVQRALHHLTAATAEPQHDGDVGHDDHGDDDDPDDEPQNHVDAAIYLLDTIGEELARWDVGADLRNDVAKLSDVATAAGMVAARADAAAARGSCHDLRSAADQVANLLDLLATVREGIDHGVVQAARADKAAETLKWKQWIADNIESGARNAHRYLSLPEEWRPTVQTDADGVHTSSPPKLLDAYRRKYDELWNRRPCSQVGDDRHGGGGSPPANDGPRMPWHEVPERVAYPRATPSELRAASLTFKETTLVAFDGIAMRHYSHLSDASLQVLADIILIIEYLGHLPRQLRFTVMPMIAKARGGHRAIASLVGLYRLWTRLRREEARKWEAANDRPYFAAGKGRGPQDAVWRQAARSEAAVSTCRHAATVLWDMSSFFETVRRLPLWHRAKRLGFPLVILRVALNAYAAPRALSMNGALARPLDAQDGVLAGCGLAMTLTKVFVVEALDRAVAALSPPPLIAPPPMPEEAQDAIVDLYVDDIAATVEGTSREVVRKMTRAVEVLRHEIVEVLGCGIEVGKAAIVASSAPLAAELKRRFGALAGPTREPATAAANLGIDYAPGRPRTSHIASGRRRRRMQRLARKAARLARIRSVAGRRAKQIFVAGPMAEAVYGAAVNGLSGTEVQALRRAAACALTPRARGRSLSAVLLFAGAPTWKGEVETILQYARQAWAATLLGAATPSNGELTLAQLSRIWRSVNDGGKVPMPGPHAWNRVRGPISAMHLTLRRIGWAMKGPFTLVDGAGEEIFLTKVPPALLAQLLRRAVLRTLEAKVGATWAADDPRFVGRRVAADHVVAQLSSDRALTAADRAAYRSVACGAIMTFSRAARGGYLVRDLCPLCKQAGDTVRHRVWHCMHPDAVAAREEVAPLWLRKEAERRDASDSFWIHGLIPHPAEEWPAPASTPVAQCQYGDDGRTAPAADAGTHTMPRLCGDLAGDGSCSTHVFPELRRAGTAIVQRRNDGSRGWTLQCPVPPPLPQTPQAAEFAVLALAAQFQHPTARTTIISDCANVVESYNGPAARAVGPKRAYAGVMREALADTSWQRRTVVRKVKAHVDPSTLADPAERIDAEENAAADVAAKEAALLHPQPSPAQVEDLNASLKRSRLIVRTVARVIQAFPPMPKERMRRAPAPREGANVHLDDAHDWVYVSGMWRCRVCMRMTVRPELTPALACQRCEGPKASLAAEAIVGRGHILAKTQGPAQVLFCVRCGAYSARRAYGLGAACTGTPKPAGRQALARIHRGLQPWETRVGDTRHRGLLGTAVAWDATRREYVQCGPAQPRSSKRRRPPVEPDPQRPADSSSSIIVHDTSCAIAPTQACGSTPTGPAVKILRTSPRRDDERTCAELGDSSPTSSAVGCLMDVDTTAVGSGDRCRLDPAEVPHCSIPPAGVASSDDVIGQPTASDAGDGGWQYGDVPGGGGPQSRREPRLPRPDAPVVHRESHRPDPVRGRRGSICPRDRPHPRPDGTAGAEGLTNRRGQLGGAPAAGSASRGDVGVSIRDSIPTEFSFDAGASGDKSQSSVVRPDGGPGGNNDAALPPADRALPVGLRSPCALAAAAHASRGVPRDRPDRLPPVRGDVDDCEAGDRWARPWLWQPSWLYLPHVGAGDGSEFAAAVSSSKRRRTGIGIDGDRGCVFDDGAHLHGRPGQGHVEDYPARASIQGRSGQGRAPGPRVPTTIRGLDRQLGPDCSGGDGAAPAVRCDHARARAQARVDARLSSMSTSIQLHAERVAAKRARAASDGVAPSAADRLAAIRRRVAARTTPAATADTGGATSSNSDVADAAARAAHHAVLAVPADGDRQLSV